jgi:hypothetical protein
MTRSYGGSTFYLPALIAFSAALGLLRFNSVQIGASYDDAHYIILAESLASGQGYQLINFPRPQMERAFPPGWPLLLAPWTFLFPGNYSILKLVSLALSLGSVWLAHGIFSKRLPSPYREALTGLVALNPLLVGTSVTVMSESAYLFFSLLALRLFDRWKEETDGGKLRLVFPIAFLIFYSQLIRTIGIGLLAALVVYLLFARRFRETGIVIGVFAAGTLVQGWLIGSFISSGYRSQVFNSPILEKLGQMGSNALGYFDEVLAGSLIPIFGSNVDTYLGNFGLEALPAFFNILILALVVTGMAVRKRIELLDIYLVIYFIGILAFWNPRVGSVKARFLIPIAPILYFYFLRGTAWAVEKAARNSARLKAGLEAGAGILIALILLARNVQDWRNPPANHMTDLSVGAAWIAENAPSEAIVMVNEPVPAYPHVRRKTVPYPREGRDLEKYLENQGVDYIIISPKLQSPRSAALDEFVQTQIVPMLEAHPEKFTAVYFNPEHNVTVYRCEESP